MKRTKSTSAAAGRSSSLKTWELLSCGLNLEYRDARLECRPDEKAVKQVQGPRRGILKSDTREQLRRKATSTRLPSEGHATKPEILDRGGRYRPMPLVQVHMEGHSLPPSVNTGTRSDSRHDGTGSLLSVSQAVVINGSAGLVWLNPTRR